MKIIDFRFRPNTPEIINGIKNSSMFKATCEAIGFDKRVPQALPTWIAVALSCASFPAATAKPPTVSPPTTTASLNSAAPIPTNFSASGVSTPTREWTPFAKSNT